MKRILMGLVWFLVIWFVARVACGAVVGGIAGGQAARSGANPGQMAAVAALSFFQHYGLIVALVSLALAVAGTATGVLPGTRKRVDVLAAPGPEQPGNWPPPPTGMGTP